MDSIQAIIVSLTVCLLIDSSFTPGNYRFVKSDPETELSRISGNLALLLSRMNRGIHDMHGAYNIIMASYRDYQEIAPFLPRHVIQDRLPLILRLVVYLEYEFHIRLRRNISVLEVQHYLQSLLTITDRFISLIYERMSRIEINESQCRREENRKQAEELYSARNHSHQNAGTLLIVLNPGEEVPTHYAIPAPLSPRQNEHVPQERRRV